jgi:hypothetical protein
VYLVRDNSVTPKQEEEEGPQYKARRSFGKNRKYNRVSRRVQETKNDCAGEGQPQFTVLACASEKEIDVAEARLTFLTYLILPAAV